jgi:anaerobic selenocysteine-containing dehydrogenase
LQLYSEVLQKFRLAADGHGQPEPPERHRARLRAYFDPLPFWYPPFEDDAAQAASFPLHAITQRPMAMYHSWGGMNAWLRQILGSNRLYLHHARAASLGLDDDAWVWISSRHGRVKAQVRLVDGVNPDTCWTWNAIAKRAGAWNLSSNAPEAQKSFLLNDLIDNLLPEREGGYRYANADPVTGQAAWYDLRVRIEPAAAAEAGAGAPRLEAICPPQCLPPAPKVSRFGLEFRRRR